ncbi:MAG: DUF4846 domain-containing protein [Candidatus Zixiibacteriota bacterium]
MKTNLTIIALVALTTIANAQSYPWLENYDTTQTIRSRFQPPDGYTRPATEPGSFAHWLQNLPLRPDGAKVYLYDGREKSDRSVYCAVVEIDTADKDLQQCADAVMRLRAEYFYSRGMYDSIAFNFTSGDRASYRDWINGLRPVVKGNSVSWQRSAIRDSSYINFREYLNTVFTYAGSYSLSREMENRTDIDDIQIGDVLIQGGLPGHVVIVFDVARSDSTGETVYLLAQGFTPAQDIHILSNPMNPDLSPWYSTSSPDPIVTPQWEFKSTDLMRW